MLVLNCMEGLHEGLEGTCLYLFPKVVKAQMEFARF